MKFKNLFKPSTWALNQKSSGGAQPLSVAQNLNDFVTIDPLTSKLIYSTSYLELSKAGYIENVIANACIRRIADTIKNMPIGVLADGEPAIESTDRNIRGLMNTIREPNTDYNWKFFI